MAIGQATYSRYENLKAYPDIFIIKDNKKIKKEIEQIVKAINFAYKTSKKDFIWERKESSSNYSLFV